jgi:hypothetical protein
MTVNDHNVRRGTVGGHAPPIRRNKVIAPTNALLFLVLTKMNKHLSVQSLT